MELKDITTNPEMNQLIIHLLKSDGNTYSLYAAKRIMELEAQLQSSDIVGLLRDCVSQTWGSKTFTEAQELLYTFLKSKGMYSEDTDMALKHCDFNPEWKKQFLYWLCNNQWINEPKALHIIGYVERYIIGKKVAEVMSKQAALENNKPYGRNWSDFLLPDQMEFLYKAMDNYKFEPEK